MYFYFCYLICIRVYLISHIIIIFYSSATVDYDEYACDVIPRKLWPVRLARQYAFLRHNVCSPV